MSLASLWTALAVCLGASLGALLRWALSAHLNPLHSALPMGTLVANLLGGYLVGVAVTLVAQYPMIPPAWRLFMITGFLGGLTTFSTFSAEVVFHLTTGRVTWAMVMIGLHVIGSLLMTLAGMATVLYLRH